MTSILIVLSSPLESLSVTILCAVICPFDRKSKMASVISKAKKAAKVKKVSFQKAQKKAVSAKKAYKKAV